MSAKEYYKELIGKGLTGMQQFATLKQASKQASKQARANCALFGISEITYNSDG